MARKIRSDIKVGNLEKKLGVAPGTITNADGSDARSDKKLGTLRKELEAAKKKPAKKPVLKKTAKAKVTKPKVKILTADQKSASKRKIRVNPKTPASLLKKVSAAIKKTQTK